MRAAGSSKSANIGPESTSSTLRPKLGPDNQYYIREVITFESNTLERFYYISNEGQI